MWILDSSQKVDLVDICPGFEPLYFGGILPFLNLGDR